MWDGELETGSAQQLLLFFALPIHAQTGRQTSNETCAKRNNSTFEGLGLRRPTALYKLMPLVYDQSHQRAHKHKRRDQSRHMLQTWRARVKMK